MRQYLLGQLEGQTQEEFEQRLLVEDDFLQEVLIAEDELVDDFLRDKLSVGERESFQQVFLSTPERLEKLTFGRTFKKYIDTNASGSGSESEVEEKPSRFQSFLLFLKSRNMVPALSFAAALFFAVTATVLFVKERNLQTQLADLRARSQSGQPVDSADEQAQKKIKLAEELAQLDAELKRGQQKRQELEQQIARLVVEKRGGVQRNTSVLSFLAPMLAMGAVRSAEGGLPEIRVPPGHFAANIPLRLPDGETGTYRASLLNADAQTLHTINKLRSRQSGGQEVVLFNVPIRMLPAGEYRIRVSRAGGDRRVLGSYVFRVTY